jgi:hypothetical protein
MSYDATLNQANHTLTIIGQQKPDRGHIKTLHSGYLSALVEAIIINKNVPSLPEFRKFLGIERPKTLLVDYNLSWEEMGEAGCYFGRTASLEDVFPVNGNGVHEFDFRFFDFNPKLSIEEANAMIVSEDSNQPWSPAKVEHLFCWGANLAMFERKEIDVVASGTIGWDNAVMRVSLDRNGHKTLHPTRWVSSGSGPGKNDHVDVGSMLLAVRPHKKS